jgi:hypothetical protein
LDKLLTKYAPKYKIKDLSSLKLISTIKRWKYYINNLNIDLENPFEIAKLYFEWEIYMFWGLWIYNMYWFSTQIAEWYTVYNMTVSWDRIIWNTKFIFKKQRNVFFYWNIINKNWKNRYNTMSIERAFIQILKEWKNFTELPYWIDKKKLLKMSKKNTSKTIFSKIKKICI